MKVRVSKCKSWKVLPVEKCIVCVDRCTQRVSIAQNLVTNKQFPLCDKHFMQWLNNELELQLSNDE